jgi:hypothetical protein
MDPGFVHRVVMYKTEDVLRGEVLEKGSGAGLKGASKTLTVGRAWARAIGAKRHAEEQQKRIDGARPVLVVVENAGRDSAAPATTATPVAPASSSSAAAPRAFQAQQVPLSVAKTQLPELKAGGFSACAWVVARAAVFQREWEALGSVGAALGRAIVSRKRQRQLAGIARSILSAAKHLLPARHPGARQRRSKPLVTIAIGAASFSTSRTKESVPTTQIIDFLSRHPSFAVVLVSEEYTSQSDPATHRRSNGGFRILAPVLHGTRSSRKNGNAATKVVNDKLHAVLASNYNKAAQRDVTLDGAAFKPRIIFYDRDCAASNNILRKAVAHTVRSTVPIDMRIDQSLPVYGDETAGIGKPGSKPATRSDRAPPPPPLPPSASSTPVPDTGSRAPCDTPFATEGAHPRHGAK